MKVVSTFHSASSVVDSLKFRLADEQASEYLVVAKLNRLDIYSLLPEGLRHEQGIDIWGRVRAIRAVPVVSRSSLSLLALTDHPEPELIFLSFTLNVTGSTELKVTKYLSLSERSARPAEFCHTLLVDPSGDVGIVSAYMGKLKVVVLDENGGYDRDFDVSITELNLLDITFVSTSRDVYTLAMMHIDYQQRLQLLARDLSIEDLQLSPSPSPLLPSLLVPGKLFSTAIDDDGTPVIVHIPSYEGDDDDFEGGLLIMGGRKIMLYDFVNSDAQAKREGKKKRADKKRISMDVGANIDEKEKELKKRKPRAEVEWPWAEVTAWCHVDDKRRRYLIGDRYGKLALLSLNLAGGTALILLALGEASAPTTLTYLANHVFYLGSHFGNSQLLQISTTPSSSLDTATLPVTHAIPTVSPNALNSLVVRQGRNEGQSYVVVGKGSYLTELESFNNLAPILDAMLVDTDGSGQNEIVTCSGGKSTGSIRVVRSGADFSERAVVRGMQNVTNLWPLKELYHSPEYAHVVVSTLQETHVFRFDDASSISCVDRDKNSGFITDLPTITVSNIVRCTRNQEGKTRYADSGLVVQVVSNALLLLEYDYGLQGYTRVGEPWTLDKFADPGEEGKWKGREIVAASVNASQVVLALNWGKVVLFTLDGNRFIKQKERNFVHRNRDAEISAVSCIPQDPTKNFSLTIVVGFWTSNHVEILSLVRRAADSSMPTITSTLALSSTPRSLLLYNFTSDVPASSPSPHLLVGLADGSIASFVYKDDQLLDQKLVSIGSLPVSMRPCRIGTRQTVLACGSRTTILFWEKERLVYSPLILKDVTAAAGLSTNAYPLSVILSNSDGLVIGNVNNFDKLHVRSIPLGLDNPSRITHIPALSVFVVACRRISPARIGDIEEVTSSIQVFDDTTFDKVGHFNLEQGEESTALLLLTTTGPVSYLCVSAVTLEDEDTEASKGRVFVLTISKASRMNISVVASHDVKGCPYALAPVDSMIAAAVNSAVIVFAMDTGAANTTLERIAIWNHNYLVTSLSSRGNNILVGDAISSITLLKLEDNRLHSIARDYGALWPTSVEHMSDSTFIGANSEYNLCTFSLQNSGTRQLLEKDGNYFLGDLVNKFLPGALSSQEVSLDDSIQPQQLFFTSSGLIGVIIDIANDLALDLTGLARNLSNFIQKHDGPNHTRYRTPKNVRGRSDAEASSFGFLDGDFLERFLQYPRNSEELKQIMNGESEPEKLTMTEDGIQKVLERMQNMH